MFTDLIFDFFGTLVSYSPSLTDQSYAKSYDFLATQGFEVGYAEFLDLWAAAFKRLEKDAQESLVEFHMIDVSRAFFQDAVGQRVGDAIHQQLFELYLAEWNVGVTYFEEIRPFLERLSQTYRLSIISNTHYKPLVLDHLVQMGITDLFTTITLSVEHGLRKPHLQIFADTLATLAVAPKQAIYVGDNIDADYVGAKNSGMEAVLIDPQDVHDVAQTITHLFDLETYLVEKCE